MRKFVRRLAFTLFVTSCLPLAGLSLRAQEAEGFDLPEGPPSPEELKTVPLDPKCAGEPPRGGLRNWSAPENLRLKGSYVSALARKGAPPEARIEFWRNTWREDSCETHEIVVRKGPSLKSLGEEKVVVDSSIVDDVFDPAVPGKLAPNRGITRFSIIYDEEAGYVVLCCVCSDYKPGKVELVPALLVSKSGEPGSFKYLGKLKGECAEAVAKGRIWSDGGSLHRLKDGRWRIYLNGFGPKLAALECERLDGEWKFLRDEKGEVEELLPGLPKELKVVFPSALVDGDGLWHLVFCDKWPPQGVWRMISKDGLSWRAAGPQPEISRELFNGHAFKCLRCYVDPESGGVSGLLSVYPFWTLHKLKLLAPAGAVPASQAGIN